MNIPHAHKTLLIALVAFAAGLIVAEQPLSWALVALAVPLLASVVLPAQHKTILLIGALMATAGYTLATYHTMQWTELTTPLQQRSFSIVGHVADVSPLSMRPYMAAVSIAIDQLTQAGNRHNYAGYTLVQYQPLRTAPAVGSVVAMAGIRPAKQRAGNVDFTSYLRKNNIVHQLFNRADYALYTCRPPQNESWLSNPTSAMRLWRNQFYSRLTSGLSVTAKGFVGLMFFGCKEPKSEDVRDLFGRWGLAHFLARSGLHIVIFVLLLTLLLRLFPCHQRAKSLLLFVVCLIYDALSWSSVSFLRAWILALLIITRNLIGRHTSYLHLLCLSCIGILAYNPCYLTSIDFQLTYALTFALTLFSGTFTSKKDRINHAKNA